MAREDLKIIFRYLLSISWAVEEGKTARMSVMQKRTAENL